MGPEFNVGKCDISLYQNEADFVVFYFQQDPFPSLVPPSGRHIQRHHRHKPIPLQQRAYKNGIKTTARLISPIIFTSGGNDGVLLAGDTSGRVGPVDNGEQLAFHSHDSPKVKVSLRFGAGPSLAALPFSAHVVQQLFNDRGKQVNVRNTRYAPITRQKLAQVVSRRLRDLIVSCGYHSPRTEFTYWRDILRRLAQRARGCCWGTLVGKSSYRRSSCYASSTFRREAFSPCSVCGLAHRTMGCRNRDTPPTCLLVYGHGGCVCGSRWPGSMVLGARRRAHNGAVVTSGGGRGD